MLDNVPAEAPAKPTPPSLTVTLKLEPFPVKHPLTQTPPPVTVVVLVPENTTPLLFPEQAASLRAMIALPKASGAGG